MEKLAGNVTKSEDSGSSSTAPDQVSTQLPSSESTSSTINVTSTNGPSTTLSPQNPFAKLAGQTAAAESQSTTATPQSSLVESQSSIRIRPAEGAGKRGREDSAPAAPSRKHLDPKVETVEDFEERTITSIFRVTLDETRQRDFSGHDLIYLSALKAELQDGTETCRLSVATLDQALMEAIGTIPANKSPLEYLLPCWKRVLRAQKSLRGYANERDAILREARRLCMSSCVFAVTMPELYGYVIRARDSTILTHLSRRENNSNTDSLIPYLLRDPEDDQGIDFTWMSDAVNLFDEDEAVKPMFTKTMAGLSHQLSSLDMNGDYKPYVNVCMKNMVLDDMLIWLKVLKLFSKFKPLLAAIAADPLFHMATSAPNIEKMTLLGPYFRISPLQSGVTQTYFSGPKTMDKGHIKSSQNALRLTLNQHQKDLKEIVEAFVRAGDLAKNKVLDWFAHIVNSNHKRRAMRVDEKTVSSDGFMMNVTVILDYLCEPFMDSTFSKVDRIDVDYLRRNPRVDIKDETKINADQQSSDRFYEATLEGKSNFITEVFFLTLAAHHYGSEATNAKMKNLDRDIKHFMERIAEMERERPKFLNVC